MEIIQPGPEAFLDLVDVPHTYVGSGGKIVAVNAGATGLQFQAGGGGGTTLTQEVPTPAVDGTTTSFTVTHAPVFVVADGQSMTSGNGYTYAAGTLTMTNPPQGYLISFYNA